MAEEATQYIRRHNKLLHKQMTNQHYEEWKREDEAKGVLLEPLPWKTTTPNNNVLPTNNRPLMNSFHQKEHKYDEVENK